MEDIRTGSIAAFDAHFTNNQIRMLKVLLGYLEPPLQKSIAVCIKFMELQYVFKHSAALFPFAPSTENSSDATTSSPRPNLLFGFEDICTQMLPYCEPGEKQFFLQISNLLQTFQNLQNMMEMMEAMKDLFPEGMASDGAPGGFSPDMFTTITSMLGGGDMDLSALAAMFGGDIPPTDR